MARGINVEEKNVIFSREELPNGKTHVRVLDKQTGANLATYFEDTKSKLPGRPPGKKNDIEFYRIYRANLLDVVREKRLRPYEAGIFLFLMAFTNWNTNRLVDPETNNTLTISDLAGVLQIERKQLTNAIKALKDKGMLDVVKAPKGMDKYVVINSQVAYYGKYMTNMSEHRDFYVGECGFMPIVQVKYREPNTR